MTLFIPFRAAQLLVISYQMQQYPAHIMDEKARQDTVGRGRTSSQNSSCYGPSGSCEWVNIKVSSERYQTNLYRYVIWSSASWDSSQTRTSIWPSCSRGLTRRNSFSSISWKCVAAITFGASPRLRRCSRIPQAKPMPSITGSNIDIGKELPVRTVLAGSFSEFVN